MYNVADGKTRRQENKNSTDILKPTDHKYRNTACQSTKPNRKQETEKSLRGKEAKWDREEI